MCYVLCWAVSYLLITSHYFNMCIYTLEPSTPVCSGEVRRWSHGSYTLLHDGEAAQAEYALDLVLPFGCAGLCPTTFSHFPFCTQKFLVNMWLLLYLKLSSNRLAVWIWWLHVLCREWRGWGGTRNLCVTYSVYWCMQFYAHFVINYIVFLSL